MLTGAGASCSLDELKDILKMMVDTEVLHNIGKEGMESFNICEGENSKFVDGNCQTPELIDETD